MNTQSVILWTWISTAFLTVITWNYFENRLPRAARYWVYASLFFISLNIIHFRVNAIKFDPDAWWSIAAQLFHLGLRVSVKAIFFLVVLVQGMKLFAYLWREKPIGLAWIAAVVLYVVALRFSWPGWVPCLLFTAIAAIGIGIFVSWWECVHDACGSKLERAYRRFRSSLVGFLFPRMWSEFLHRYKFTRALVRILFTLAWLLLSFLLGSWTGEKTFPHLFGLEFGPHWLRHDNRVLLPYLVVVGTFIGFAMCIYILYRSIKAEGHRAMGFLAISVGLMILISWGTYWSTVLEQSAELKANRELLRHWPQETSPEKHALLTRYRRLVEYRLGTREWNAMVFHRLADEPYGLPSRFPGFLIGVEQANRYLLGITDGSKASGKGNPDKELRGLLDNRRRTFLSHIAEFRKRVPDSSDAEIVQTGMLYNLYESVDYENAYTRGFREMDKLKDTLSARLTTANGPLGIPDIHLRAKAQPNPMAYTHLLVYCMGWNTDQQESIRNYNSLMGFLYAAAREDGNSKNNKPFHPLVIGLSWPSEWSYLKPLSYLTKAGDADETGLVWGSYLLKNVIKPLKKDHKLPVVLVGHSFGARVLSRAIASRPDWIDGDTANSWVRDTTDIGIDLFIGLQGAFSANRFVTSGRLTSGWMDAGQYLGFKKLGTRFILTWSDADDANPMAAYATGANHVGGKFGHWFSLQHDSTFWPCVYTGKAAILPKDEWKYKADNRYDSATGWTPTARVTKGKIFSLDLSPIVKEQPYGKGGGAHSDIYTPEIGRFLWKTILAFAPGEFKDSDSIPGSRKAEKQ